MDDLTYRELIVPYENAVRTTVSHITNLQHELQESPTIRNPIDSIHFRIKSHESLEEKCISREVDINDLKAVKDNIKDIGGIRIICLYKDDVYKIATLIGNIPGVSIVEKKDYLNKPKKNGYQSLHLIAYVQVPTIADGNIIVPVEIQIRTVVMQAWAQVEHRSKYKAKNPCPEAETQLREVAELLEKVDDIFTEIRLKSVDD